MNEAWTTSLGRELQQLNAEGATSTPSTALSIDSRPLSTLSSTSVAATTNPHTSKEPES